MKHGKSYYSLLPYNFILLTLIYIFKKVIFILTSDKKFDIIKIEKLTESIYGSKT